MYWCLTKQFICLTNCHPKDLRQYEECRQLCVRRVKAFNNVMNRRSTAPPKDTDAELVQAMIIIYMCGMVREKFSIEMFPESEKHSPKKERLHQFLEASTDRDTFHSQYGYDQIGAFILGIGNKCWPLNPITTADKIEESQNPIEKRLCDLELQVATQRSITDMLQEKIKELTGLLQSEETADESSNKRLRRS